MPSKYLSPEERVVRYVPWGKLAKDENEAVIGPIGAAFELREGEEYLSVTWCEYFEGDQSSSLRCAVEAIRTSELGVKPKAHFAVGVVGEIAEFMAGKRKLRFIHERAEDNPAHSAIRAWPAEEAELFDRLAETVWRTVYSASQIDSLTASDCLISTRGAS